MGNLGGGEILVILLVGLIVLGPAKLPTVIRQVSRFAAETRRVATGFRREFQEALNEPIAESKATLKAADPGNPSAPPKATGPAPDASPSRDSTPSQDSDDASA